MESKKHPTPRDIARHSSIASDGNYRCTRTISRLQPQLESTKSLRQPRRRRRGRRDSCKRRWLFGHSQPCRQCRPERHKRSNTVLNTLKRDSQRGPDRKLQPRHIYHHLDPTIHLRGTSLRTLGRNLPPINGPAHCCSWLQRRRSNRSHRARTDKRTHGLWVDRRGTSRNRRSLSSSVREPTETRLESVEPQPE